MWNVYVDSWPPEETAQSVNSKGADTLGSQPQKPNLSSSTTRRNVDLEQVPTIRSGLALWKICLIILGVACLAIACTVVGIILGIVFLNAGTTTTTTTTTTTQTTATTTTETTTTSKTTTTTTATTTTSALCFYGEDEVRLVNGDIKTVRELRSGMKVYSMNSRNEIIEDEVIMILHREPNKTVVFCVIETSDPRYQLSVTCDHYVAVSEGSQTQYLTSDYIIPGEHFVYVRDDLHNQLQLVQVKNVIRQYKTGFYNLATSEGTLIVNNIVASCYSDFTTIRISHNVLGLFRLYYKLAKYFSVEEPFKMQTNGIPKPIEFLMDNKPVVIFIHDLILSIIWFVETEVLITIGYLIQIIVQKNIKTIGNFH